jgi:antirestriction protein ArdC
MWLNTWEVADHLDGPKLMHVPGDRAAYNPATDTIRLPRRTHFRAPGHYYATAFHEAGHSTGHPQRLNRPGIADFDHFGSGKSAREELIAQMPSSMLCAQTGTDTPAVFDESASYIVGWLHALNDDKRLVITAAAHAQRASDLIAQPEHQAARTTSTPAPPRPSRSRSVTSSVTPRRCPPSTCPAGRAASERSAARLHSTGVHQHRPARH